MDSVVGGQYVYTPLNFLAVVGQFCGSAVPPTYVRCMPVLQTILLSCTLSGIGQRDGPARCHEHVRGVHVPRV